MSRPGSSAGARASSRRGAPPPPAAAADPVADTVQEDEEDLSTVNSSFKTELESIASGTHPALIEALEPHQKRMDQLIAQADRVRQLQIGNINALFECEKKQTEDENKAQLEFFKSRLIDTIEEKRKKAARAGDGSRLGGEPNKPGADSKGRKRPLEPPSSCLPSFALKPEELKADMEEMNTNQDHYSVRSAAAASDELRGASTTDAVYDRHRQTLTCNGLTLERGAMVTVYMQGQRLDETWQLQAMSAVEVSLKDPDGQKLKVTLAQLRNGRYAFRPASGMM